MRIRGLHLFVRLCLFAMIWASLSGCLLQQAIGFFQIFSSEGSEVDRVIANILADTIGGNCSAASSPFNSEVECAYVVDGEVVTSTVDLISELGLLGVLIDPLILEVPAGVFNVTATYDRGGGPQALVVDQASSFRVNPGLTITAEVGTKFLFLDLPGDVMADLPDDPNQGVDLDFSLSFEQFIPHGSHPPMTIKPMVAGMVVAQHQKYYIPLLPCVTDFADVPAVVIPEAASPQPLDMALGDLIRNHDAEPCDHVVHDFSAAASPPGLVFAPLVRR
jgi:hypothetical protein